MKVFICCFVGREVNIGIVIRFCLFFGNWSCFFLISFLIVLIFFWLVRNISMFLGIFFR